MNLRCKPNTVVMVEKPSCIETCSAKLVGVPVAITRLHRVDKPAALIMELTEGPVWMLKQVHRCPFALEGCEGIDRLPDACLRPFDAGSTPEPDEVPADLYSLRTPEVAHG